MSEYVSEHYKGEKGRQYVLDVLGGQNKLNHLGYTLQSRFFRPFLYHEDRVLDFGCGNGSLAVALAPYVKSICGLEVNEHSRKLAIEQGLQVFSSLKEIPQEMQFEKIISNHVLEHIADVFNVLCRLRQYITRDGCLIVMLPVEDFRQKRNQTWTLDDLDRHLYTWTPLLFGNLLNEAGYMPKKLDIVSSAWSPKLFFLGDGVVQTIASGLLAVLKKRRQLFAVAELKRKI